MKILTTVFLMSAVLFGSGCAGIRYEANLADGSSTRSSGYTVGSKSALEHAAASQSLSSTNASRSLGLEGVSTQAQFAEMGQMAGTIAGGVMAGLMNNPQFLAQTAAPQPEPAPLATLDPQALRSFGDLTEEEIVEILQIRDALRRNADGPGEGATNPE